MERLFAIASIAIKPIGKDRLGIWSQVTLASAWVRVTFYVSESA